MYFTKVELHNFGIYKGTHEMCLTDQIGNRNITLVGGLNGRGKTTFHDSILIALYGKQALKYIQEKARSYDKLLLDHINKHATDEETYVAVSLCLDDGTVLRVKRSWTARGKKVEQQTIVEKDGVVDKRCLGWTHSRKCRQGNYKEHVCNKHDALSAPDRRSVPEHHPAHRFSRQPC